MAIAHCFGCSPGLDFHGTAKAFALVRGHAGFPLSVRARLVRIHIARLIPDLNDRASESLDAAFAGCKRLALALIEDGVAGAARFKDGLGRHGDFARIR